MVRNRNGPLQQAKHEDHAHAAHQEESSHGHAPKPGSGTERDEKSKGQNSGHRTERTPRPEQRSIGRGFTRFLRIRRSCGALPTDAN
jgi:hypothetical protein